MIPVNRSISSLNFIICSLDSLVSFGKCFLNFSMLNILGYFLFLLLNPPNNQYIQDKKNSKNKIFPYGSGMWVKTMPMRAMMGRKQPRNSQIDLIGLVFILTANFRKRHHPYLGRACEYHYLSPHTFHRLIGLRHG